MAKKDKSLKEQSEALFKKHLALGEAKRGVSKIQGTSYKRFTSVRSYKETASTMARIASSLGVFRLRDITSEMAHRYLYDRKNDARKGNNLLHAERQPKRIGQKTLDAERKALSVLLNENIARTRTNIKQASTSRAYSNEQVKEIIKCQTSKNALATEIALSSGIRAHELYTIRRFNEVKVTYSEKWHKNRFIGNNGERYIVEGKGGLVREIRIEKSLADRLESLRLQDPRTVTDREAKYKSYYDISGGNKLSSSFTQASKRALGFSNGVHGIRHQYAQQRMLTLQGMGYKDEEAKLIVSQEVGHFRASITNVYLR